MNTIFLEENIPKKILETKALSLSYGSTAVFRDINLPIYEGKTTTLMGPSGCGKSSFLLCLNMLIHNVKKADLRGEVLFEGRPLSASEPNIAGLRKKIGMIFQTPTPFPVSIWKNIEVALKQHGVINRSERNDRVEQSLKKVGLWSEVEDRLQSSALELSGGQSQRLCIARTLALSPEVILMDEPCCSLDPLSTEVIEDLIKELSDNYTLVIVTHNLSQARRIGDYTAFFWYRDNHGYLVEIDKTERLFAQSDNPITQSYINGLSG